MLIHMPLHATEWMKAKEMEGEVVYHFVLEEANEFCNIPIYVRRFGILRLGWTPYGIPYAGNSAIVRNRLGQFLRDNKLLGLLTYSFQHISKQELTREYGLSSYLKRFNTYILNLENETVLSVYDRFNNTTRKHIRRAKDAGFEVKSMTEKDIEEFFVHYLQLCKNNRFSPTCTKTFLLNLFHLCQNSSDTGLNFFGLRSEKNGGTHGYLIGLSSGRYFFEFLRANVTTSDSKGFDRKLLTYEMISSAIRKGDLYYDFGGINPRSGPGVMAFKRGFGGMLCTSDPMKIISAFSRVSL